MTTTAATSGAGLRKSAACPFPRRLKTQNYVQRHAQNRNALTDLLRKILLGIPPSLECRDHIDHNLDALIRVSDQPSNPGCLHGRRIGYLAQRIANLTFI